MSMIQKNVICLRDNLEFILLRYTVHCILDIAIHALYYLVVGNKKIKKLPTFSWMMFLKPAVTIREINFC